MRLAARSGKRGFAGVRWPVAVCGQILSGLRGERVIIGLEPGKLGSEITYTLPEAVRLRGHAGVRAAEVAK